MKEPHSLNILPVLNMSAPRFKRRINICLSRFLKLFVHKFNESNQELAGSDMAQNIDEMPNYLQYIIIIIRVIINNRWLSLYEDYAVWYRYLKGIVGTYLLQTYCIQSLKFLMLGRFF